ncbi:hypothetical protein PCANC_21420 [Puccinia coronata f. sp. avenae]|uniref:Uncharacterized protein n=1 Tax=Puccinia coronata f. sp. avenae TaxID=200324 RepID=A0A2N5RZM8_9BASI|nr:hypothetical protein PCANC_21420 [Puccinia coronata f. sp. avenae]
MNDQLAVAHVGAYVKSQLEHVRYEAQDVLLAGMIGGSDHRSHIPPIAELSRFLWRYFMSRASNTMTDKEVDACVEPCPWLRARFVFMRPASIHHYVQADPRHESPWDQMDQQLLQMRQLPISYPTNWWRLLCVKDARLFGSAPHRNDLRPSDLAWPTQKEVQVRLAARHLPT